MNKSKNDSCSRFDILIPSGFNPAGKNADKLALFAADLLRRTSITAERRSGHFVPYGRDKWRRSVGGDYGPVRREAIDMGLIEANDCYSVGKFAKSVRLAERYRSGSVQPYHLRRKRQRRPVDEMNLRPVGMWLRDRFRCFTLAHQGVLPPWAAYSRQMIQTGDYFAVRCEYGRFHSNFTSLSTSLRNHLRTDEPLVEIDVGNCQPLLLAIEASGYRRVIKGGEGPPYTICDMDSHSETLNNDHRQWLTLCEEGQLYEFFLERFQAGEVAKWVVPSRHGPFEVDPMSMDRSKVKLQFLICMFATEAQTRKNPCYQILRRHFPTIASTIDRLKQHGVHKHRNLAMRLQHAESEIMIDGVCEELRQHHSNETVLTIHDSVICRSAFASTMELLIHEQFSRVGIVPALRKKAISSSFPDLKPSI